MGTAGIIRTHCAAARQPRGIIHSVTKRGRGSLLLLAVVGGVFFVMFAHSTPSALAAKRTTLSWSARLSGSYESLISAAVVDSSTGWIVGGGGTILHTVDGGNVWTRQVSGTWDGLLGAACVGPTHCWAVGDGGTIVHTSDGGATWGPQASGISIRLTGVDFVDVSHGWATGEADWYGAAGVVHTSDGGLTWEPQTLPAAPPGVGSYSLVSVDFVDADTGWAVGGTFGVGVILHTTDGGATWDVQDSTTAGQALIHVCFLDATTGWAVGEGGVIIHTEDGGVTWSMQPTPTTSDLHSVTFVDASNGWAVGVGGTILHTTDGGATWRSQVSGTWVMFSDVAFADAEHGWATGEFGVVLRYGAVAKARAARIRGTVVDPDGTHLKGILVTAYAWGADEYGSNTWTAAATVATGRRGTYDLRGLPSAYYTLEFSDPLGVYLGEYYDNEESFEWATPIWLEPGAKLRGIDATLSPPCSLHGAVTSGTGAGALSGVRVDVFRHDPWGGWAWITGVSTDDSGGYEVTGLHPGEFRLSFSVWDGIHVSEFYDDAPTLELATSIILGDGQSLTGLDAVLDRPSRISGSVTDSSAEGIADVGVELYISDTPSCSPRVRARAALSPPLGPVEV